MAELVLQGVSKVFSDEIAGDHVAAVRDLNLTIRDQELIVLVGPSGCGKTTTLRLIAGLDAPCQGVIRFDGRSVDRISPRDRNVAMVFQHSLLYPHLSVYNNVAFGLRMRQGGNGIRAWWTRMRDPLRASTSMSRRAIAKQVLCTARLLGIEHLLDRMPHELSGGERQRVALGRAIVRRPAAFLLDEPLSSLDPQLRVEMRRELKRLHRRLNTTMVYVTHDQTEAMALGDRLAVMHAGRLQQVGTPQEVYANPANVHVARLVGEPTMNLWQGRLRRDDEGHHFVGSGLSLSLPAWKAEQWKGQELTAERGQEVVLGIRPHQVVLRMGDQQHRRETNEAVGSAEERLAAERRCGWGSVVEVERLGATVVARVAMRPQIGDEVETGFGAEGSEHSAPPNDRQRGEVTASASATETMEVGAQVAVYINTTETQIFDAQTGQTLLRAGNSPGESQGIFGRDREP